jgi:small subunit ribosomal protein S5
MVFRENSQYTEKVLYINRCTKVVKGGRRFSFSAIVAIGDKKGKLGIALGKSKGVPESIRKAVEKAKKRMKKFNIVNKTVPHKIIGIDGKGKILFLPARRGTGIIANNKTRMIFEVLGIKNIFSKSIGSNNYMAIINATMNALNRIETKKQVLNRRLKLKNYN